MIPFSACLRSSLFLLAVLLPAMQLSPVQAATAGDSFISGNQAYMHKKYTAALKEYKITARQQGFSKSLLYNIGNCYAQLGETGRAVLAYEQALRIEHTDPDVRANLATVQKENGIYQENRPWWQRPADLLGADQWLMLLGSSFLLFSACLLLIALLKKNRLTPVFRVSACIALLTTLMTLPPTVQGYRHWKDAVILTKCRLKISPFAEADSTAAVKAGQIVHPRKSHYDFFLVSAPGGRKGWVNGKELGFIDKLEDVWKNSDNGPAQQDKD